MLILEFRPTRGAFRTLKIKIINDRTLQKQSIKPISMENHLPIFSYGNKMRLIIDIKSPSF